MHKDGVADATSLEYVLGLFSWIWHGFVLTPPHSFLEFLEASAISLGHL